MFGAVLAVLAAALPVACGAEDRGGPASPPTSAGAVTAAPERVREAKTLSFEARYTRTKATSPPETEEYATSSGALDLSAGHGRMVLDLSALFASLGPQDPDDPFAGPLELRWDGRYVYAQIRNRWKRATREQARGALIGKMLDEPPSLIDLLEHAQEVRAVGTETVGGDETTRFTFSVDARKAGGAGVPAELHAAFERAMYGPELAMEAWVDADGLPRRIAYSIEMRPVRHKGRLILPARTVRADYELSDFGAEVDVAPPPAELVDAS